MRFLINPGLGRGTPQRRVKSMAKRRTQPRHKSGPKKGQFKPRARRKRARKNPGRTVAKRNPPKRKRTRRRRTTAARKTTTRRRRSARRNPPKMFRGLVGTFTDGIVEAGQILVGKAAVRSIPDLANLPKQGNVGLAVQAGTALVIGYVADMFLSANAARAMTAGALTAPLETLIVSYRVPWLSTALAPVSAASSLQAYVQGGGGSLGRYARRPRAAIAPPGNSERGLGRYATERGMSYSYDG